MKQQIEKALEVLKSGGLIIYPTDTIWGIGCDATNAEAVAKIYRLKENENKKSMLILVKDIPSVARYTTDVPQIAWDIMEVSDTPLTVVLPGAVGVAANLIPEENTIGIRVPDHEFCRELLKRLARPLVSTSVNKSGEKAAIRFVDIPKTMLERADFVVDAKFEKGSTFKASSIMSIDKNSVIKIIRE